MLKFRKDPFRDVDDSDSEKATSAKQMPSPMAGAIHIGGGQSLTIHVFYMKTCNDKLSDAFVTVTQQLITCLRVTHAVLT